MVKNLPYLVLVLKKKKTTFFLIIECIYFSLCHAACKILVP